MPVPDVPTVAEPIRETIELAILDIINVMATAPDGTALTLVISYILIKEVIPQLDAAITNAAKAAYQTFCGGVQTYRQQFATSTSTTTSTQTTTDSESKPLPEGPKERHIEE